MQELKQLLHLFVEWVHDIYDTVAAEDDKHAEPKRILIMDISPKRNIQYQIHMFRKATEPGEMWTVVIPEEV